MGYKLFQNSVEFQKEEFDPALLEYLAIFHKKFNTCLQKSLESLD